MSYLSSKNIVHGDLATRNVLIASDTSNKTEKSEKFEFSHLVVQVSDFGLAQILHTDTSKNHHALPFRWAAMECLRDQITSSTFLVNETTDVWSFGVTIWEILTFGQTPYEDLFEIVNYSNFDNSTKESTYSEVSYKINKIINSPISEEFVKKYNKTISNFSHSPDAILTCLLDFLIDGGRLEKPMNCTDDLYIIMLECNFYQQN